MRRLFISVTIAAAVFSGISCTPGMDASRSAPATVTPAAANPRTAEDVDRIMTELSNWGRWGKDDQLGTTNLITPETRRRALAEVREGYVVSMSHNAIKVEQDGSAPFEQKMLATGRTPGAGGAADMYSVRYHGFSQTHLDAICHSFYKGRMYNGFSQEEVTEAGAGKLSVINFKNGLCTRAVLMDIPRLRGQKYLRGRDPIYPADLDRWLQKAGIQIRSADALLIRTGRWARRAAEGEWQIDQGSAGLHVSCLKWIKEHNISILASDLASDVLPSGIEGSPMPIHQVVIGAFGMPLLDACDFEAVSEAANERQRWTFVLTVAPLAVEGGTGSPVNPLAMF